MATVRQTTTTTRTTTSGSGGGGGCHCVWNWSFVFAVMDFIVGVLVTVAGLILMFDGTFRQVIVGIVGLCFGVGILSSTTMTCEAIYNLCFTKFGFYWTWSRFKSVPIVPNTAALYSHELTSLSLTSLSNNYIYHPRRLLHRRFLLCRLLFRHWINT